MDYLVYLLLFFILLSYWRFHYKKLLHDKTMYKLYALRDELRWLMINNEVTSSPDAASYLDFILSKSISQIQNFSLSRAVINEMKMEQRSKKETEKLVANFKTIDEQMAKNEKFEEILGQYWIITTEYMLRKHTFSVLWFLHLVLLFDQGRRWYSQLNEALVHWVKKLTYPQRSNGQTPVMA